MKASSLKDFWLGLIKYVAILICVFMIFSCQVRAEALEGWNLDRVSIEYLRLDVPVEFREAWLRAEKDSWSLWLENQKGFLDRQLFWDRDRNEGHIFIRWSSRNDWKSISQEELNLVQKRFESLSREFTGQLNGNPFPITREAELIPQ